MSNLVPDNRGQINSSPQSNLQIQISLLDESLLKQEIALALLDTTDTAEINKSLETIAKIAEILRSLRKDWTEEQLTMVTINEKIYSSEANITEAKFRNISIKTKQILGIISIPILLVSGGYSYIYLQQPSLGLTLVIFGLSGGLLTFSKEDIKLLIPPTKNFNDSQK
jgi:hypothetical protein